MGATSKAPAKDVTEILSTPRKTHLDHLPDKKHLKDNTRPLAANPIIDVSTYRPVVTPIYHTTTYTADTVQEFTKVDGTIGYRYQRLANPSLEDVESRLTTLDDAAGTLAFSSGTSAIITTLLTFLQAGDHVVIQMPIYYGTYQTGSILRKYGIDVTWSNRADLKDMESKIQPNTKVLYGETPSNPKMDILDLVAFGTLGKKHGIITVVDNTFCTPYIQKPLKLGVDIAVYSATKYLGGHSDILGGCVSTKSAEHWRQILFNRQAFGNTLSPFDASLLSRGIKTLGVRMEKHARNAALMADFLNNHPQVSLVYYPGLTSHPGHDVAKRQMKLFGGMLAFKLKKGNKRALATLLNSVGLLVLSVSLGGVESSICHPASMMQFPDYSDAKTLREIGEEENLVRLSVGIEDFEDLRRDLARALDKVAELPEDDGKPPVITSRL